MKLISFEAAGRGSYGILKDDGVVDLKRRLPYASLRTALADWQGLAQHAAAAPDLDVGDVTLLPPVPDPGRVICIGLNYKTHIAETNREPPAYPMAFSRFPDSLVAAEQPMIRPSVSDHFDFEGELAVVIGRGGRHIAKGDAMSHVAGYSCFNDGSIRDYQQHTTQFLPGKNFWRSGSFGPWLVTPDEVGPLGLLELVTRLNGAEMQRARLDDLLFDVADLIVYLSQVFPLEPGDVIATGTTGGVGAFREPPVWMKSGDVVEVSIDRVGALRNRIQNEAPR